MAATASDNPSTETESNEKQQQQQQEEPKQQSEAAASEATTDNNVSSPQQHEQQPQTDAATTDSNNVSETPPAGGAENQPGDNDAAAADGTTVTSAEDAPAALEATPPVTPRVVIVTGASSGLGLEVTKQLCEAGHDVILACRNEDKTNRAIEKLRSKNQKAQATYMHLDLGSWESIRKFVDDFHLTGKKLSVLINNAGVALNMKDNKRQYTKDNVELTIGTNHFGHFLLTHLLLNDLKETASEGGDARVVVISSGMHDPEMSKKRGQVQPMDLDNLFLYNDGSYNGLQAYKNSKLANVMFAYELSRQLDGTGVKVNVVDPGFVPTTELLRHASSVQKFYTRYVLHGMLRFTKQTRTSSQAASTICSVSTSEKFKELTGKYIRDGVEAKSSEESLDEAKQKKLWELTGGYLHLDGFEPLELPIPPPETVKEETKPEQKPEEAAVNGEAAQPATGDSENKTSAEKPDKATEIIEDACPKAEETNGKTEEKTDAEKEDSKE